MINIPKTKQVGIFIPTFGRPHALHRVIDNLYENTPPDAFTAYFILEKSDQESYNVASRLRARVIINEGLPCYADAINTAYHKTLEPYFFTGADDLGFNRYWLEESMKLMQGKIQVVGTNDLGSIPIGEARDSTHYLIDRAYIAKHSGVIDMKDTVLYPNYIHNWTDKEFIETATMRGVYAYAPESKVEHLHPAWGKAKWDETYKKGQMTSDKDRAVYEGRRHLWA
jgi:hypothetical protein